MSLGRTLVVAGGLAAFVGAAIACGSGDASEFGDSADAGGAADSSIGGGSFGDGGATRAATGVVLVHAAAFKAFRVCFSGLPNIPPQPDRKVMPESNSVGVEMGGAVRLGPLGEIPGKVYIIPQLRVAATPEDPDDVTCGAYIENAELNDGYLLAGTIDRPVGTTGAEAIIVTGCGTAPQLAALGVSQADCPDYADGGDARGTLGTKIVPLLTTNTATPTELPVELYNASPDLSNQLPSGAAIDVTYGDLDAGPGARLAQTVAKSFELYESNPSVLLDVDQSRIETFGSHGFRIAYRRDGGAADAGLFSIDQTLAEVQEISQPLSTPTTYFTGATNFALLLLGDPRIVRNLADGGPNPGYDGRRAVHLLAIPVLAEQDAGAIGPTTVDVVDAASDAPR